MDHACSQMSLSDFLRQRQEPSCTGPRAYCNAPWGPIFHRTKVLANESSPPGMVLASCRRCHLRAHGLRGNGMTGPMSSDLSSMPAANVGGRLARSRPEAQSDPDVGAGDVPCWSGMIDTRDRPQDCRENAGSFHSTRIRVPNFGATWSDLLDLAPQSSLSSLTWHLGPVETGA